jgi:RNA polymerase sigma factor (sigma-70 family)
MRQKYQPIYEAIQAGHDLDEELWEELISHCRCEVRRRIEAYNFTFLAVEDVIDRIVHDFGGELARTVHRYDPGRATFKTYVNGIIDNMVKNAAKQFNRRKREKTLEVLDFCKTLEGTNDPENLVILKEEIEELYEILNQLTAKQYQMIKLKLIEGLSVDEIVIRIGIPPKKVSNRLNKAIMRIKILKERNHTPLK